MHIYTSVEAMLPPSILGVKLRGHNLISIGYSLAVDHSPVNVAHTSEVDLHNC